MSQGPDTAVPSVRIRNANQRPVCSDGDHVLYWMIAARRPHFNFGLQRAADWARHLGRPLLVLEALRTGYRWASDRLHRFVIDGMADNAEAFAQRPVTYWPYVEKKAGEGKGLLEALAADAAVVVTDEFPTFFLPRMVAAAAERLDVRLEVVDSNGLLPLASTDREFTTAHSFRRHLQKELLPHLECMPLEDPLADSLPDPTELDQTIRDRWPRASRELLAGDAAELADLPIDHDVPAVALRGGHAAADRVFKRFVEERLERYEDDRNLPESDAASGLSPYLHFGHISSHEIFLELMHRERWSPEDTEPPANGRRAGWWGVRSGTEAFLDQLVTWRELGYNVCAKNPAHDRWESLPGWARETLGEHAGDRREHTYSLDQFASAATHDPLWNAAQRQLVQEGTIHNYLRMLWGKKILEWTSEPKEALAVMIELNNRFALDGRDPNSYSGILWVLGRHDRAWGPERPIFGKVRYMSSDNTARKFKVKGYLERYGGDGK